MKKFLLLICLLELIFTIPSLALAEEKGEEAGAVKLEDVVVTATKTPHTLKDVPVETIVITREDIERTNAQNAMDILKNIPGVQASVHDDVFGTYTWQAKLRGLSFDEGYGLILIDGQRVMGCGQSGGMGEYGIGLNQIPVDLIERVEVVKGPSSALYGSDAMAGVINIITKKLLTRQRPQPAWHMAGTRSKKRLMAGRSRNLLTTATAECSPMPMLLMATNFRIVSAICCITIMTAPRI